ncbi:MAG: hypothetical protein ING29_20030 [Azospirillum sp.]|nr:hypothetical protein [Azospirillum sp.]
MRILLDENIPVQLRSLRAGHLVRSVNDKDLGWKAIKNGKLLSQMEGSLDLLITADKNMYAQQNLSGRTLSILVLPTNWVLPTNRRSVVLGIVEQILRVIATLSPSEYAVVDVSGVSSKKKFGGPGDDSNGGTSGLHP